MAGFLANEDVLFGLWDGQQEQRENQAVPPGVRLEGALACVRALRAPYLDGAPAAPLRVHGGFNLCTM
eukprot:2759078-Prymnesium_polylepis.1